MYINQFYLRFLFFIFLTKRFFAVFYNVFLSFILFMVLWSWASVYSAGIYLLKVSNRNTRTRCEICSKLKIKTPERRQWLRSGVFCVNFEHISYLVQAQLRFWTKMKSEKQETISSSSLGEVPLHNTVPDYNLVPGKTAWILVIKSLGDSDIVE